MIKRIRTFNYFSKTLVQSNANELNQQIIATRLFFLLLMITFIILISYYSAVNVLTSYRIEAPSFEQFLHLQAEQRFNPSLSCPCSIIATTYEKFIQIDYTLHPFCYSYLLQAALTAYDRRSIIFTYDFRSLAKSFFTNLITLCKISTQYIENRLITFNTSIFVADQMPTPQKFAVVTEEIFGSMKMSTIRSFMNTLYLITNMTRSNEVISGFYTNYLFRFDDAKPVARAIYGVFVYRNYSSDRTVYCDCFRYNQCFKPISIFLSDNDDDWLSDVPDLYTGCLLIEGIRVSRLSCLFDQVCLNFMTSTLNTYNVIAINPDVLVHFKAESLIDDLINELFVDQWNFSASFRNFYAQCQPDHCVYTLSQRNSVFVIFTTVYGLIGGLISILRVTVPRLIHCMFVLKSLYQRYRNREIPVEPNRSILSFDTILRRLKTFNVFATGAQSIHTEDEIRNQIIATRLFLILLVVSVAILTIYSSQTSVIKTIRIISPSMEEYNSLLSTYADKLTCPCKNITIPRRYFLNLQPTFHQICYSSFIDSGWASGLANVALRIPIYTHDFRCIGGSIFKTLASFCQSARIVTNDGFENFLNSSFITPEVLSQSLFHQQGQSLISLFISTSENEFLNTLQINRDMSHVNVLLSPFGSSVYLELHTFNDTDQRVSAQPMVYNHSAPSNCTCYTDPTCMEITGVYGADPTTIIYPTPGFFVGCQMVEATLKSNLAILYNQSWINEFRSQILFDYYNPFPFETTALNVSIDSQYNLTTSIQVMVDNLMVEDWYPSVNYSAYYKACSPIECKYSYVVKYDIIYIITTIIGLIGGLVTVFQIVVPRAVRLIRRCWLKRHRRTMIQVIPIG